jgi:hypothetical protein
MEPNKISHYYYCIIIDLSKDKVDTLSLPTLEADSGYTAYLIIHYMGGLFSILSWIDCSNFNKLFSYGYLLFNPTKLHSWKLKLSFLFTWCDKIKQVYNSYKKHKNNILFAKYDPREKINTRQNNMGHYKINA